jgi:hypothetical protein
MFFNAFRRRALERIRSEHPEARLDRAAFTPEAWHLWCLSFPTTKDRPAILVAFSDDKTLAESLVRNAAEWTETTGCGSFRIYVAPHTMVADDMAAMIKEEAGEVVRLDLAES